MMSKTKSMFMIADDLTGAADAGTYFRTEDRQVRIGFSHCKPWDETLSHTVVQVYDAETRSLEPRDALSRVMRAAHLLTHRHQKDFLLYKKLDSTLRGHVGAELEGTFLGSGKRTILMTPSYPENGRTVIHGCLFIDGIPVDQSSIASDPRHKVRSANVAEILKKTTSLPIQHIRLETIRDGVEAVCRELVGNKRGIVVCDAETRKDLEVLAKVVHMQDELLPAGSAGFAQAIAQEWLGAKRSLAPRSFQCDYTIVAVGSAHPRSYIQVDTLCRILPPDSVVPLAPTLLADMNKRIECLWRAKQSIMQMDANCVAVYLHSERPVHPHDVRFENDLASLVRMWVDRVTAVNTDKNIGIVATGGDTAMAICHALGVESIRIEQEIEHGVIVSRLEGPEQHRYYLVSKAGGFGQPSTLVNATHYLSH